MAWFVAGFALGMGACYALIHGYARSTQKAAQFSPPYNWAEAEDDQEGYDPLFTGWVTVSLN